MDSQRIGHDRATFTHTLMHLGRKAVTNLDSIIKSRDIRWPTKVHLVKAIVFAVVVYVWRVGP